MGKPKGEPRAAWVERESIDERKKRAQAILRRLERAHPETKTALDFTTPFELLVATVLSAQSTDKKINEITPALFAKYRKPEDYLAAKPGELEQDIKQSGFFNQKSKSIKGLSRMIVEEFGGEVPRTMEELVRLPGVARKTANVVLSNAFGIDVGIAVDTHVHRLSWRFGFSDHDDAVKVEQDLMAIFPKAKWFKVTHLLIDHGRATCFARAPKCLDCPVADLCPASRLPGTGGTTAPAKDVAAAGRPAKARASRSAAKERPSRPAAKVPSPRKRSAR